MKLSSTWAALTGALVACTLPPPGGATDPASPRGDGAPAADQATAICQHLGECGLADDQAACVAEMAGYDPEATASLVTRSCDELAELKAGGGGGGGGGGGCATSGVNDCGGGQMCCAAGGGAAMAGVPGTCVSVAVCTGPHR